LSDGQLDELLQASARSASGDEVDEEETCQAEIAEARAAPEEAVVEPGSPTKSSGCDDCGTDSKPWWCRCGESKQEEDVKEAEELDVKADASQNSEDDGKPPWTLGQSFVICKNGDVSKYTGRAMIIDPEDISSVTACVDELNAGKRMCEAGVCLVYSSSRKCYYVLYKRSSKNQAYQIFPEVEEFAAKAKR